jgi:hypothetical protein
MSKEHKTRYNEGRLNLYRAREAQVAKAIADRKEACRTGINLTVAEYFLAILTVQSPLRHSVTLWRRGEARCQQYCQNSTD